MPSNIFVVVVSYNGLGYTKKCVETLLAQSASIRVLVWDNASTDGTRDWLISQKDVEYHLSEENLMWSPAINKAIELFYQNENFICFMNNDIELIEVDTLKLLSDTAKKNDVGMVAPAGYGIGGVQDFVSNAELYSRFDNEVRVNYVIGSLVLMRYSLWKEIGILDPNMPLGADDHDYSIRVKHEGYKIIVRKDVVVNHISHVTGNSPLWEQFGGPSWEFFNKKWDSYYANQIEATVGHWDGVYNEDYPKGTGWTEEKYNECVSVLKQ